MSTKGPLDSQDLQKDLNQELELDADDIMDQNLREDKSQDDSGEKIPSELPQQDSSNANVKKTRSRPRATKVKSHPKRRKTSDSDTTGESFAITSKDMDPAAGPSSAMFASFEDKERTPDKLEEEEVDPPTRKTKKTLRKNTMDADETSDDETSDDNEIETNENDDNDAEMKNVPSSNKREDSHSTYRVQHEEEVQPSTSRRIGARETSVPSTSRSAALEEIFRLPIYESDSRGSVIPNFDNGDDEDEAPAYFSTQNRSQNEGFSSQLVSPPPQPAGVQVSEEEKNIERKKIMWARKLFFMSTELIFPGFTQHANSQSKQKQYMAVRVRSSWVLQALLYADLLFFVMWFMAMLSTFDIAVTVLKELHGNLILSLASLFTLVNIPRLAFGFKGNEKDKMELLALFWMITFIVSGPLFGFILFTDIFTPVRLAFTLTMDSIMMVFIILEVIVSSLHLKNLIRDELKVIELAKKSDLLFQDQEGLSANLRPRVVNTAQGPVVSWVGQGEDQIGSNRSANRPPLVPEESDDDWSTDESVEEFNKRSMGSNANVGYRMKIRRLHPHDDMEEQDEPEKDDSNQVSSTSDSFRHRPIRVN